MDRRDIVRPPAVDLEWLLLLESLLKLIKQSILAHAVDQPTAYYAACHLTVEDMQPQSQVLELLHRGIDRFPPGVVFLGDRIAFDPGLPGEETGNHDNFLLLLLAVQTFQH
jgi:hypothetical protein